MNNNLSYQQNQAIFHIPSISILDNIIKLLHYQKQFPYAFYENRIISEIYDAFPGAIWNGRTPLFNQLFLSLQQINEIKEKLENNNLSLNLTWNNHLLENNHLYDTYSNNITSLFNNNKHSITVSSELLFKYLKNTFPNYKFYQSHIKSEFDQNIDFNSKYDIIIAPKYFNNNWNILNQINNKNKNKIEFLCNDICSSECNKTLHYDTVNKHLLLNCYETVEFTNNCPIQNKFFKLYNTKNQPTTINPEDIDKYIENDFYHFKIASRGDNKQILLYKICKYLIKPEYFEDIYFSILGG